MARRANPGRLQQHHQQEIEKLLDQVADLEMRVSEKDRLLQLATVPITVGEEVLPPPPPPPPPMGGSGASNILTLSHYQTTNFSCFCINSSTSTSTSTRT